MMKFQGKQIFNESGVCLYYSCKYPRYQTNNGQYLLYCSNTCKRKKQEDIHNCFNKCDHYNSYTDTFCTECGHSRFHQSYVRDHLECDHYWWRKKLGNVYTNYCEDCGVRPDK